MTLPSERRRHRVRSRLALASLCAVSFVGSSVLVACGGNSATKEKPLTDDQVQLVANAFFRNHEAGGITFALSTVAVGGGTITMQGTVDFKNLTGQARIVGGASPNPVTGVMWGGSTVLERRPTLDGAIANLGYPGVIFVARPIDTQARRLDGLLSVVMGLATAQPENAVLVRQREGSAYLRDDELRGTKVEVLRFGERLILWVDPLTGDLLRFEGTNTQRTFPIIVDIIDRGPVTIPAPLTRVVVSAGDLGDDYLAWAPQSP